MIINYLNCLLKAATSLRRILMSPLTHKDLLLMVSFYIGNIFMNYCTHKKQIIITFWYDILTRFALSSIDLYPLG